MPAAGWTFISIGDSQMPLVRIDLAVGKSPEYRRALCDGVHRALVEATGIPEGDRFQIVTSHEPGDLVFDRSFLGIERSDDIVFVQITLRRGRHPDVRKRLYLAIVEALHANPGVRREDVMIALTENDPVDWSMGNGEASLLRTLPAILPQVSWVETRT